MEGSIVKIKESVTYRSIESAPVNFNDLRNKGVERSPGVFRDFINKITENIPANFEESINKNLLHTCTIENHLDFTQALLRAGADVETCTNRGDTPLMYAAYHGDHQTVKLLLEAGADVNKKNRLTGHTALIYASYNKAGCSKCVALLLDSGADVNACDHYGNRPLVMACLAGYDDIVQLLVKVGSDVKVKDTESRCVLSLASLAGFDNIVKLLIDAGADVNAKCTDGMTPLMYAAYKRNPRCIKLLLDGGAKPSVRDNSGNTAYTWTVTPNSDKAEKEECVTLLTQGDTKFTALNVYRPNNFGDTPLMHAACYGCLQSINALIEAGANLEHKSLCSALEYATHNKLGRPDCIEILINAGADVNAQSIKERILFVCLTGNLGIVRILLEAGVEVNVRDREYRSALSLACIGGHHRIVKLLLESGADVNTTCKYGMTPLMYSGNRGNTTATCLLLEAGAAVNQRDKQGNTALLWALTSNHKNHDCVPLLVKAGALLTLLEDIELTEMPRALYDSVISHMNLGCDQLDLHHQCRKVIRAHLVDVNPKSNLVAIVSRLPLPTTIKCYLLYDETDESASPARTYEQNNRFVKQFYKG